ncbi:MAG TPA: hypothetical protein VIL53_05925 [Solirubrobacterales bacterium]|jgi:hypothetical protein
MLKRRPSPAMIVAIVALIIGLTGTAVAGVATISKISGKTVKKNTLPGNRIKKNTITGKQVKESSLGQVPSANTANTANTANSANPVAFARVASDGTLVVASSKGVAQSNITHPNAGVYCFSGLGFTILGAQVTPIFNAQFGASSTFQPGNTGFCPSGGQVTVVNDAHSLNDNPFLVMFYG